jgi:hypothetical protein
LNAELTELIAEIEALKAYIATLGKDETDCIGMAGYESEAPGDGITGYYYDNEDF